MRCSGPPAALQPGLACVPATTRVPASAGPDADGAGTRRYARCSSSARMPPLARTTASFVRIQSVDGASTSARSAPPRTSSCDPSSRVSVTAVPTATRTPTTRPCSSAATRPAGCASCASSTSSCATTTAPSRSGDRRSRTRRQGSRYTESRRTWMAQGRDGAGHLGQPHHQRVPSRTQRFRGACCSRCPSVELSRVLEGEVGVNPCSPRTPATGWLRLFGSATPVLTSSLR